MSRRRVCRGIAVLLAVVAAVPAGAVAATSAPLPPASGRVGEPWPGAAGGPRPSWPGDAPGARLSAAMGMPAAGRGVRDMPGGTPRPVTSGSHGSGPGTTTPVTSGPVAHGRVPSGSLGSGSAAHRPVTSGSLGSGSVAHGRVPSGSLGSGPVTSGPVGSGSGTRGPVTAGVLGAGSGALLGGGSGGSGGSAPVGSASGGFGPAGSGPETSGPGASSPHAGAEARPAVGCDGRGGPYQRQAERWLRLRVDGKQSAADCRAIRAFQRKHGIQPATGTAGPATWARMRTLSAHAAPHTRPPRGCPARSYRVACVDLTHKRTWVQQRGRILYGPVPMRSGSVRHPTRTGWFRIYWKHRHHWSSLYNSPMPYAQFFSGGQAFHAVRGSIRTVGGSMGCVNLRLADARGLWKVLRKGDHVYVWGRRPRG